MTTEFAGSSEGLCTMNHREITKLKTRWINLFQQYADADYLCKGFDDLVQRYAEPHRHYHTLVHVVTCLNIFDKAIDNISDSFCVETAIWFHDVIYTPQKGDNEYASAKHAKSFLSNIHVEEEKISKIENLICLTKHPTSPSSDDEKYLIDIDLMILGAEPEIYEEYDRSIKKEYSFVPNLLYKKGRKKLLKSFIEKNSIYETNFFIQRFEKQARDNLKKTIHSL